MKKKTILSALSLLLLLALLAPLCLAAQPPQAQPYYTGTYGVEANLDLSGGFASCKGTAKLKSGYTGTLTVELKQDGVTIATWTKSGSRTFSDGGTRYVSPGHTYTVTATVVVNDSEGNYVESPSVDSSSVSY